MDAYATRQLVSAALTAAGPAGKGNLAADPMATMLVPGGELPGGARLARFDTFPHPGASFYVGIVDRQVFYLTESPQAFSAMLRASGRLITTPELAVAVARAYVETTRSMRQFSQVVDDVDGVRLLAPRTPQEESNRAEAANRLRALIRPPVAVAVGDRYQVTLYVLQGSTLERRTLTISRAGDIAEHTEVVASALPTPISM